jgi:hypothetical protein
LRREHEALSRKERKMTAYSIDYTIRNKEGMRNASVDAKDIKSAKKKIGKRHGFKDGRMIQIRNVLVVGYY